MDCGVPFCHAGCPKTTSRIFPSVITKAAPKAAAPSVRMTSQVGVFFSSVPAPTTDSVTDIGTSGKQWKDLYMIGQAIGLRTENYSTAGRPSATAGTAGRLYYDTTLLAIHYNRAGTWTKFVEKVKVTITQ